MTRSLFLPLISAFQLFSISAFTQASSLEQLQQSFMKRYDEANATRDESLKKLETSYLGALKRHMDKVKASGRLELVVPVRDEIQAIETGTNPLPDLPDNAAYDFKQLRKKYVDARDQALQSHAETLVDLADKMDEALKSAEAELTKTGKIDEALAAKRMRETLDADKGIASARALLDVTSPATPTGAWKPLLEMPFAVKEGGTHYTGPLEGEGGVGKKNPPVVKWLSGQHENPREICQISHGARIEFKFAKPVSQFRGTAITLSGGDALFQVRGAGGLIVLEERINKIDGLRKEIEVKFAPTRRLSLELESTVTKRAYAWIAPEVR